MPDHDRFYGYAELYDIAFSFKRVPEECAFLLEVAERFGGRAPGSFLELAAGPASNARELARRGLRSVALDLSSQMQCYALDLARREGLALDYHLGDMTDFRLETPVDLAAILMDSACYLLDNEAVLRHLECVAEALVLGGIYVLEMAHPRDLFGRGASARTEWSMERGSTRVEVRWGAPGDPFDSTTQVGETSARLRWRRGEECGEIEAVAPQRSFGPNELRALVHASGCFELVAEYGSLDAAIPFSDDAAAWRMVPVLRRR